MKDMNSIKKRIEELENELDIIKDDEQHYITWNELCARREELIWVLTGRA